MATKQTEHTAVENFVPAGDGIDAAIGPDGKLYLRVETDIAKGKTSASGKMKLTGSTGGWSQLPLEGVNLRANVMVGAKV